jgi:peptidoglycan/LPS O-acetylase OafA/YrhL
VSGAGPKYRPDIDGLRAIAVAAVIAFHALPAHVPGGFTGVDIFFVISGYLITGVIAGDLAAGTFTLKNFYLRRIRRIFPALAAMLVVATIVAWAILLPDEWRAFGKHGFAGAAFVSNLVLAREGGYFDWAAHFKPLLHLWSLGVEEQFYFVWPLFLALLWKLRARLPIVLVVVVASFAVNLWGIDRYPVYTFYLPVTRLWELGLGSLLALVNARRIAERRALSEIASWSGIAILIASLVFVRQENGFPGVWALLPTIGTMLSIAAGPNASFNRFVLASRGFVFAGLISYPLYLWHWPLFSFARIVRGGELSPALLVALVVAAIVLATLTYRFIERPVRSVTTFSARLLAVCGVLIVIAIAGALGWSRRIDARLTTPAIEDLVSAAHEWEYPFGQNFGRTSNFERSTVPGHDSRAILFIGDSHLEHYWPRLARVHARQRGPELRFVTNGGCPPLPHLNAPRGQVCRDYATFALREAHDPRVTTVVFGAYWPAYVEAKDAASAFEPFGRVIRELVAEGKRVWVVLPGPSAPKLDPRSMISRADGSIAAPPVPLPEVLSRTKGTRDVLRSIAVDAGAEVVDPIAALCSNGSCASTLNGRAIYRDESHLRPWFVREHASYIDRVLLESGGAATAFKTSFFQPTPELAPLRSPTRDSKAATGVAALHRDYGRSMIRSVEVAEA